MLACLGATSDDGCDNLVPHFVGGEDGAEDCAEERETDSDEEEEEG